MAQSTGINRKKIMVPTTMSKSGWALIEARDDVEGVEFVPTIPKAEFHKVLEDASGICLGVQPFSDPELDAASHLEVVSRIGVGYDAVDVPALTRRNIPLMIGGTANSVSVAEAGVPLRTIAEAIGQHLDLPVTSIAPENAGEHFGWLAAFLAIDVRASSRLTRQFLGWQPTHPDLIPDLDQGHYFREPAVA